MKDAYYFPHDSNAIDDPKIMIMVSEMGLESYAIYWIIIEHLRQQPDFVSHIKILKPLALRHGSSDAKFYTVVNNYGLFIIDENNFFSPSLTQRMQPYIARQVAGRKAGIASGIARNERTLNDGLTSKVKESKVKDNNIPSKEDFINHALSKISNIDRLSVGLKYEAWIENDWYNGNGKKIKNWKSSLTNTLPYLPTKEISTKDQLIAAKKRRDENK